MRKIVITIKIIDEEVINSFKTKEEIQEDFIYDPVWWLDLPEKEIVVDIIEEEDYE